MMADYDLAQLAREAGVKIEKILKSIEGTRALEDELFLALRPVIEAYQEAIGAIASEWDIQQLTAQGVEAILAANFATGRQAIEAVTPGIENWVDRVERWHRRRWSAVVKGAVRLDIEPILAQGDVRKNMEAAVKSNVALIRGLSAEIEKKIEARVWQAYQDGDTNQALARALREEFGFSRKRALLIAQDQFGKFSGALDRARHEQAGIEEYVWSTVGDDRVRPKHRDNNKKRFRWDTPPKNGTGHPGHDIRCRCKSQAVLYTAEEEAFVRGTA